MTTVIDGAGMGLLLMGAYKNLARSAETINALNVFPVPDGDTGTNMSKTLGGGFNAPASSSTSTRSPTSKVPPDLRPRSSAVVTIAASVAVKASSWNRISWLAANMWTD